MSDTIEVDAKPIDTELDTLSRAEKWLAKASERVAEKCEQYRVPEVIETEQQRRDAVESRAACRKDAAEIDNERKALLREMEDRLKAFKREVKDVLSPLTDLDVRYKELLDNYEELWRTNRRIELEQEYEDLAPNLVPLVPFELILKRYGSDTGKVWLNRSTNSEAAKTMLGDAIFDIAENEKAIGSLVDPEDAVEAKARYFATLDFQGALTQARRDKEQRERVKRLEAERAMREAQPEPEPAPMPEPVVAEAVVAQDEAPAHHWYISFEGDRAYAELVADTLRKAGLRFERVCSDTGWKLERRA